MKRWRALCWILAALTVPSCSPPAQEPAEAESGAARDSTAPIQTDKTSYVLVRDSLGWGTQMNFRFTNVTTDTLYAVNCNGATSVAVEREDSTGWTTFWAPITNACLSPPI